MPSVEDTKCLAVEAFSRIDRYVFEFVDELAGAGFADAAATEIITWKLLAVLLN